MSKLSHATKAPSAGDIEAGAPSISPELQGERTSFYDASGASKAGEPCTMDTSTYLIAELRRSIVAISSSLGRETGCDLRSDVAARTIAVSDLSDERAQKVATSWQPLELLIDGLAERCAWVASAEGQEKQISDALREVLASAASSGSDDGDELPIAMAVALLIEGRAIVALTGKGCAAYLVRGESAHPIDIKGGKEVELHWVDLKEGDSLILLSPFAASRLETDEICDAIEHHATAEECVADLVDCIVGDDEEASASLALVHRRPGYVGEQMH